MGMWSRLFGGSPEPPTRRIPTVGAWTILIPAGFELIDNGKSLQAYKDDQVVYVSSLSVLGKQGQGTPARELYAKGVKTLDGTRPGKRYRFAEGKLSGEAQIARMPDGWQLTAFMVTVGVFATCVIDFPEEADRDWALSTWKSLEHS